MIAEAMSDASSDGSAEPEVFREPNAPIIRIAGKLTARQTEPTREIPDIQIIFPQNLSFCSALA
jgi:hypothetical protein